MTVNFLGFWRFLAQGAGALALACWGSADAQTAPQTPKLVVVIAVDQFSAGLYEAWRDKFTGGLKRLSSGIVYPIGYQSHAATETCPGHSTILTGKHPNKTGIVGNSFRNPATGETTYCLADPSVTLAQGDLATSGNLQVSPANLLATTFGEWLKASSPQSRVVAISSKDRAAIVLAGRNPDSVFWLAPGLGFTTYLRAGESAAAKLAPVAAVNAQIAKTWTTLPVWNYAHADCRALASTWTLGYETFKSELPPALWGVVADPETIKGDVMTSPIADDLTLAGARGLIRYYNLGKGPGTDLLAVSFSATDYIGHRYGTQGPEMCEQMYRLDASLAVLFAELDALGVPYMAALTADHGGSDFTERLAARGYDASRAESGAALTRVNTALRTQFGLTADPLIGSLEEANVAPAFAAQRGAIAAAAAKLIAAEPGVAGAFTQEQLLATPIPRGRAPDELTLQERFAESTYPGRSPDVSAALQPGDTSAQPNLRGAIAGHGSPWDYDRRVPILFWWKGAPTENRTLPVETVDIAPSLAAVVGLTPPSDLDGRCLPLTGNCPRSASRLP
jgi:predicted AlkP superfamily pyrophosphatase or phosphodiesterase